MPMRIRTWMACSPTRRPLSRKSLLSPSIRLRGTRRPRHGAPTSISGQRLVSAGGHMGAAHLTMSSMSLSAPGVRSSLPSRQTHRQRDVARSTLMPTHIIIFLLLLGTTQLTTTITTIIITTMEGGATTEIAPRIARGIKGANTEIGIGTSIGAKRSALVLAASSGLVTGKRPGPKGTRFARVPVTTCG